MAGRGASVWDFPRCWLGEAVFAAHGAPPDRARRASKKLTLFCLPEAKMVDVRYLEGLTPLNLVIFGHFGVKMGFWLKLDQI